MDQLVKQAATDQTLTSINGTSSRPDRRPQNSYRQPFNGRATGNSSFRRPPAIQGMSVILILNRLHSYLEVD